MRGGGVLGEHPLGVVRAPDPDPVALGQTDASRPRATRSTSVVELGVGEPHALVAHDERLGGREPGRRRRQVLTDRLAEQRHRRRTVRIREHHRQPPHRQPPITHPRRDYARRRRSGFGPSLAPMAAAQQLVGDLGRRL